MAKRSKPKAWRNGLCTCTEDCPLALTVCCCGCNATGQAYHRATGSGCFCISLLLWTLFVATQTLNISSEHLSADAMAVVASVACFLGLVSTVATTYFVCTSRRIMRERDEIPRGPCGPCDDCCVGWWCSCCALVQMFRQDAITSSNYRLCTEEAV